MRQTLFTIYFFSVTLFEIVTLKNIMPTQKPRIALTVPDDLNDLLDRLSDLSGTPKTKLIVEMLEQYSPVLEQVLSAMEQMKADKEKAPQIAKKFANEMLLDATSMVGDFSKEVKKL
ncbi:MAG: hypothetical protein L0G96_11770 [Acinetobacter sp.]|nr:hypothetical protein [Acinetobacter sp.]